MNIEFNKTVTHIIENVAFGTLPPAILSQLFRDGRIFSHFMEHTLAQQYQLTHVAGCKDHDLVTPSDPTIKYDQKTFTKGGCTFAPSYMKGTQRSFNKEEFDQKVKDMNYIIVSNVNFPEIKIRFVKGPELAAKYPRGEIPFSHHNSFFA
jgi:hypothetical protein